VGITYSLGYGTYTLLLYLIFALLFLIGMMVVARGRLRDVCLVASSILLCLILAETYELLQTGGSLKQQEKIAFAPDQVFGWTPRAPGVFHVKKVDQKTGSVIFDVINTIDEHLQRKTISAINGPTVAFFGDSFTFGQGLQDSETLPQIFSDLENRRLRVLNFGITGYGRSNSCAPWKRAFSGTGWRTRVFSSSKRPRGMQSARRAYIRRCCDRLATF